MIRIATERDLAEICILSNEINNAHFKNLPDDFLEPDDSQRDAPYWRKFIEGEASVVFVAEDQDKHVVGAVATSVSSDVPVPFIISRPRCSVATIVVNQAWKSKGIGKQLMSAVEGFAKEHGATDVRLDVMAFNKEALAFYNSLGFGEFSLRLSKSIG